MTRVLVTGAGGMLGRDLVTVLGGRGDLSVDARTRTELDITDPDAVDAAVAGADLVINAAAWTDVDGAEAAEAAATAINGDGVANLARACGTTGARLVHVSTDYVFPGDAGSPYPEDSPTSPVNAYGRSKLAGEQAIRTHLADRGYVVRTAWLYGEYGPNFVTTMLKLAATRETVQVVDDQRGQPTWSYALAEQLVALGDAALAGTAPAGAYHGTASGETTWFGLAQAVFAGAGLDPARVHRTTSDQYPRPAARPSYSVLGHHRWAAAGLTPQPAWDDQLRAALTRPAFADLVPGRPAVIRRRA
jgi:dTDP-4-dehydrorhamnose reductase